MTDRELDLLLELAWWRQEYGVGISYAARLALLQPTPPDRSYIRRSALPSQSQEPEAVDRQPLTATTAPHALTRPNVAENG